MTGLNDNHKRRILTSLQYADKLLEESLRALAPGANPLFSGYVRDLSPAQSRWVESYAGKIREQMSRLLEKCAIEAPSPATFSSGKLRTCLTSLDLTLEDIHPEKMRGYGKMDSVAARDLSWTLQEIHELVGRLLTFLSESRGVQARGLPQLEIRPALVGLIEGMAQIIATHGLVEFLPALNAIIRKAQSHRYVIAVFGKRHAGKSSLINRLLEFQLLPVGLTPITAAPIHIIAGSEPQLRVSFLDRVEELPVGQLAQYGTGEKNHANSKRVIALEASVPSRRLQEGVAFVDATGIGCFPNSGTEFAPASLPNSDLGLVLIDGRGLPGREDLDLLRALKAAGTPSAVMISKCDLLAPEDIERVLTRARTTIVEHLGSAPEVIPISSMVAWAPALSTWFERTIPPLVQASRAAMIDAVERRAQSLRASLLATLEMQASRTAAAEGLSHGTERILRRMDESVATFQQHWEHGLDRVSAWSEEILEQVASILAHASAAGDPSGRLSADLVAGTVILAVASRCHPLLQEYLELTHRLSAGIDELKKSDHAVGLITQEFPGLPALPPPEVSMLDGVTVSAPEPRARTSQAAQARHFRRELEEMLGARLLQILEELQPRLTHWFLMSLNALKESLHLQTDPLRYRSPSKASAPTDEKLMEDISFLRSQNVAEGLPGGAHTRTDVDPRGG